MGCCCNEDRGRRGKNEEKIDSERRDDKEAEKGEGKRPVKKGRKTGCCK